MDIRTKVPTVYGDWNERFGAAWKDHVAKLQAKFGAAIQEVRMPGEFPVDMPTVYVSRDSIIPVLEYLKTEPSLDYSFLSDLTATDEEIDPRFEVVYHLLSRKSLWRIRLKVRLPEGAEIPTAVSVWPAAEWAEREVWDMFGIRFSGHPNLRRILMDERWEGHPLRKDFPLRGYQIFPTPMEVDEGQLR